MYRGLDSRRVYFQNDNIYYEGILAPMENIPLADNSIDVVFSINSLHHSADLGQVFREIARILKPSGVAYLPEDTAGFLRRSKREKEAQYQREHLQHNDHVYSFSQYQRFILDAALELHVELPMRFKDKIGVLRYAPRFLLHFIYTVLNHTLGMPCYLKVKKK